MQLRDACFSCAFQARFCVCSAASRWRSAGAASFLRLAIKAAPRPDAKLAGSALGLCGFRFFLQFFKNYIKFGR